MLEKLFAARQRRRFDRLDADQLRKERIRLDQLLSCAQDELCRIEHEKSSLFEKGTNAPAGRRRESIARHIQRLDLAARHRAQRVKVLESHLRVLEGLVCVRENQQLVAKMRLGSVLHRLPMDQLTSAVEDSSVSRLLEMEKFHKVSETLENALEQTSEQGEDDLRSLLDAMEQARVPDDLAHAHQEPNGHADPSYHAHRAYNFPHSEST